MNKTFHSWGCSAMKNEGSFYQTDDLKIGKTVLAVFVFCQSWLVKTPGNGTKATFEAIYGLRWPANFWRMQVMCLHRQMPENHAQNFDDVSWFWRATWLSYFKVSPELTILLFQSCICLSDIRKIPRYFDWASADCFNQSTKAGLRSLKAWNIWWLIYSLKLY